MAFLERVSLRQGWLLRGVLLYVLTFSVVYYEHCVEFRYFDAHGNYYAKDDPESVQDNWLTDVDWTKVRDYWLTKMVTPGD